VSGRVSVCIFFISLRIIIEGLFVFLNNKMYGTTSLFFLFIYVDFESF